MHACVYLLNMSLVVLDLLPALMLVRHTAQTRPTTQPFLLLAGTKCRCAAVATMSSSPAAAWSALIKSLKPLVDGPTDYGGSTPAYQAASVQLKATTDRPMTRAGWKRLILENKVNVCVGWTHSEQQKHAHGLLAMSIVPGK
jgi:hypothetical protein